VIARHEETRTPDLYRVKRRRIKPGVEVHSTVESLKIARDVILERELELAAKPANPLSSN
jgi:hypothetical protein